MSKANLFALCHDEEKLRVSEPVLNPVFCREADNYLTVLQSVIRVKIKAHNTFVLILVPVNNTN